MQSVKINKLTNKKELNSILITNVLLNAVSMMLLEVGIIQGRPSKDQWCDTANSITDKSLRELWPTKKRWVL